MRITDKNSIINRYVNNNTQQGLDNKAIHTEKSEHNFDKIMISANSRQIEEKKITESLSKDVMTQVKQGTSSEKLEQLTSAVQSGQYQVDADAVASRILLLRGED